MATQLKKTVKPSGGDYTSLEACMNANEQNLVTADKYFDVEIDGDWSGGNDTSECTIHNYTTSSSAYINIYTTATAFHGGKPDTTKYCNYQTDSDVSNLRVHSQYVTITGLFFKKVPAWDYGGANLTNVSEPNVVFASCYWQMHNSYASNRNCLYASVASIEPLFKNCVIWSSGSVSSGAMFTFPDSIGWEFINCTVIGWEGNFPTDLGGGTFTNNISHGRGTYDYGDWAGEKRGTFTTNLSFDSSGEISNKTLTFVDSANGDFHLLSTDTDAIDVGTDITSITTVDIDGQTREVGDWDVGADEYFAPTNFSRGDYASLPTTNADLETIYSAGEITQVSLDDSDRVSQTGAGQYIIHQYKADVEANTSCSLKWNGQSSLSTVTSAVKLQIYKVSTTTWEDVDTESGTGANTDFDLTGTIADLTNYKDGTIITCRVYQLGT